VTSHPSLSQTFPCAAQSFSGHLNDFIFPAGIPGTDATHPADHGTADGTSHHRVVEDLQDLSVFTERAEILQRVNSAHPPLTRIITVAPPVKLMTSRSTLLSSPLISPLIIIP